MGWRDWLFDKKIKSVEPPSLKEEKRKAGAQVELLECTPALLGQTFLAWVVTDLDGTRQTLRQIGKQNIRDQGRDATEDELDQLVGKFLDSDKEIALFRQLCIFYDALWYKILLPDRIIKTARVPLDSIETYREIVRQKSMEAIAKAEYLPAEWRNWSTEVFSPNLRADFEFYMRGIIAPARQHEFEMILNFTRAKDSGPVYEMLAWLHMRTREILGLVDKKEGLLTHLYLWNSQVHGTSELINTSMAKVVPVLE